MKKQKQEKGITLIALVITIIVLLILAGVTINLTLGEHGIFRTAENAGKNYTEAQDKELAGISNLDKDIEDILNGTGTSIPTTKVYARLYTDGTLILSSSDYIDAKRTISEDYGDISEETYDLDKRKITWLDHY